MVAPYNLTVEKRSGVWQVLGSYPAEGRSVFLVCDRGEARSVFRLKRSAVAFAALIAETYGATDPRQGSDKQMRAILNACIQLRQGEAK